jgi:hypothetical protein
MAGTPGVGAIPYSPTHGLCQIRQSGKCSKTRTPGIGVGVPGGCGVDIVTEIDAARNAILAMKQPRTYNAQPTLQERNRPIVV